MKKKTKKLYRVVFTTRKDFTYIVLFMILTICFLYFFIIFFDAGKYLEAVVSLLFIATFISFILNNKIILEKYFIRINFGIFSIKIKYNNIRKLYISDNHFIGLASSYHKVGIKTSKYKWRLLDTFVSPMDREDFIYEVNKRR